jgi:putative transposase
VDLALAEPELSPRELAVKYTDEAAYFVSESTVYRLLKAQDLITSVAYILIQASGKFQQPTTRVNQMWQTGFTYLKVIGWVGITYPPMWMTTPGLLWLGVCVARCRSGMSRTHWTKPWSSLGCDQVHVKHKPRLPSDNGPSYVASELKTYLGNQGMTHTRGRPYHPMTQGKIERWHRSMKNQALLEHYYLPDDLERRISQFVDYYNHERYHESLDNLTPADVFYGRGNEILKQRQQIKVNTLLMRKQMHYRN